MITEEEAKNPKEATEVKEKLSKEDVARIIQLASNEIQGVLLKYNCKLTAHMIVTEDKVFPKSYVAYNTKSAGKDEDS